MSLRLSNRDPRTVARQVVGLFDSAFPRLLPGIVVHLNKANSDYCDECVALDEEALKQSSLQHAMLFEIAVAAAESLLNTHDALDWEHCFEVAATRQRRFYDAKIPGALTTGDKDLAFAVANNLVKMLRELEVQYSGAVVIEPFIPGFGWVDCGVGDYSVGQTIIEVKCTSSHFVSSDYRQILIYWLLSYLNAIENETRPWEVGALLNPRLNFIVEVSFDHLVALVSGGRSKIEVAQAFSAMILHESTQ